MRHIRRHPKNVDDDADGGDVGDSLPELQTLTKDKGKKKMSEG